MIIEKPHTLPVEEVIEKLKTSPKGISSSEAKARIEKYGYNVIEKKERFVALKIFLSQFKDVFVIILMFAAALSFLLGERLDSTAITIILILNSIVGFTQEYRSEKAIEALKKLTTPKALVLRDGREVEIPSKEVVPGDILILEEGTKISADARVIESVELRINEAVLTGESVPVRKFSDPLPRDVPVNERKNMVFMGTHVVYGRGKAVVVATGMNTEFGKIAEQIQKIRREETPLQKKMKKFAKKLAVVSIIACIAIFLVREFRGESLVDSFLIAVALAVSVVPEGLPAIVTVTLALGARKLAQNNALVKRLSSAETLGAATVICSDKTGTITKGEMTVRKVYVDGKVLSIGGSGYDPIGEIKLEDGNIEEVKDLDRLLDSFILCNNAEFRRENSQIGDPTELSLIVAAIKGGKDPENVKEIYPRIKEIPFSSERKRMTTVHDLGDKKLVVMKGAVETVLDRCTRIVLNGSLLELGEKEREEILRRNDDFASNALRVLAFAYKELDNSEYEDLSDDEVENDLIFLGLAGMVDPPREEVFDAIKRCKDAGIKVVMITGDHHLTAKAIAKEVGIYEEGDLTLGGEDLERISAEELKEIVDRVSVYSRVSPIHKLKIVEALKSRGEIVAMTGDGVNDAPALKKADIGIAMGITGTDVSKEAADMILVDDNFATIVRAVELGRQIYDNIRKFVRFLLSCNFDELLVVMISTLLGWPIPLTAIMILWINLVTDGAPALALSVDPSDYDVMKKKPRKPEEGILEGMLGFISTSFLLQSLGTLLIFYLSYFVWLEPLNEARTMAFLQATFFELFVVWNARSEVRSVFKSNPLNNKYLLLGVLFSAFITGILPYTPVLRELFGLVRPTLLDWALIIFISSWGLFVFPEVVYINMVRHTPHDGSNVEKGRKNYF
ncbi:MAG: cation-translocating P-type ATPase [Candidatus Asgardarchaeia archaeon]